jgi:Tfp pilus assembly protein PilZ
MDADKFIGTQKIKRYSTSFSRLLMLILDMSEAQQLMLLKHAKDIVDKRTKPRNPCLIPVNYTLKKRNFNSFILDINSFGAYIETSQPFPVGQQINLTFFNPFSHKHIDLAGQIIWSSAYAIGVKFNDLPRHRKDMISFFAETEVMNKKAG